jgi:hypothetical protein
MLLAFMFLKPRFLQTPQLQSQIVLKKLHEHFSPPQNLVTNGHNNHNQGRTGHITRWEKSHGAPLVWGPLRQSGAPQHHDFFFFF